MNKQPPLPQPHLPGPTDPTTAHLIQLLGIEPISWGDGQAALQLVVDDRHLRNLPILHGGVTATLLDSALGVAASSVAPEGRLTVTAQLNINFIRPAFPGECLIATGTVKHSGRQSVVASDELNCESGELVATATGTFLFTDFPSSSPLPPNPQDTHGN